ncbi:hypothetical protein [Devosia sp.]|uniref:hypothetical protein n=1 Tax=Devosia sp. TaxID=1871048 RepID=UPI002F053112
MQIRKTLLTVAVAAALGACGGGSDTMEAATPAVTASALRSQAQALRNAGVTPEEAARQLMDAAESAPQYAGYFPSHQPTQSAGPFHYRHYPETGVYLGVVVVAGTSYEVGAIYVIGGPFGGSIDAPVPQGLVTNYITPVAPTPTTPPPAGAGNGCFDLALLDTQGTRLTVSYSYTGAMTGTQTIDSTVGGLVSFQGYQARETVTATTSSMQGGFTITAKVYAARTGAGEVTQYGMATEESTLAPAMRTVYTPPWVDRTASLAIGESFTATQNTSYSYVINGAETPGGSYQTSSTTTYLGNETVTVPAGTYDACKFEVSSGPGSAPSTNWFVRGKGLHVKSVNGGVVMEATSVKLNGQAL